eukprot:COSAG06_NODE_48586_length_331_cov_0.663793_1_plen_68_part_01
MLPRSKQVCCALLSLRVRVKLLGIKKARFELEKIPRIYFVLRSQTTRLYARMPGLLCSRRLQKVQILR